jgi:hypothetical protein
VPGPSHLVVEIARLPGSYQILLELIRARGETVSVIH